MASDKLAIFDFCDTLINGQTIQMFIEYAQRHGAHRTGILRRIVLKIVATIGKHSAAKRASARLEPLHGFSRAKLELLSEGFLHDVLLTNENKVVVDAMLSKQKDGYTVVLVSAAIDTYLEKYAKHYGIEYFFGSRLRYIDDRFDDLRDYCYAQEKVARITEALDLRRYDLSKSFAYTDHISDVPLLRLVGNGVIVSRGQDVSWRMEHWSLLSTD